MGLEMKLRIPRWVSAPLLSSTLGAMVLTGTSTPVTAAPAAAAATPTARAPEAPSDTASAASDAAPKLDLDVQRFQLDNGLRVVMHVDRDAPTVAVCVTYDVGARNEQPGRSGFAHLFEHMMFQGSRNVPKGGHFTLISARGGTLNGTTSSDRTNYYEVVPSGALPTVLWLEADRLQSLAVTRENFENQRQVVQEEYRMRVSNAAYAQGLIRVRELAYGDYWPYAHDAIGSMQDLDNAKLEWLREFHQAYYAPNNAVLAISGGFDPEEATKLVQRFFGDAKPTQVPPYEPPAAVPPQTAERVETLQDHNAKTPGVYQAWVIPPARTEAHYALELATIILAYGDSSALHQRLVREQALLRQVDVWTYDHRGPDLFTLRALLTEQAQTERVLQGIDAELQRLATQGPTAAELNRAKQQLQSYFLFGLESQLARSVQLANFELFWGDARLLNSEVQHYQRVTAEALRDAVAQYLTPERRTTVHILPPSTTPAPAAPATAQGAQQ